MLSMKKLDSVVTALFIRSRWLTISLFFIWKSYFVVPKNVRLKSRFCFVMKILKRLEIDEVYFNNYLTGAMIMLWNISETAPSKHTHLCLMKVLFHQIIHYVFGKNLTPKVVLSKTLNVITTMHKRIWNENVE